MCRCVSVFSELLFLVVCSHHIPWSCASRFALSHVNCAKRNTHKTQNTQHAGRKTQHRTAPPRVRCCSNRVLTRMASVQMIIQHAHTNNEHAHNNNNTSTQDEDSVPVTNRVQRGETSCALTSSNHLASLSEYIQRSL